MITLDETVAEYAPCTGWSGRPAWPGTGPESSITSGSTR